MNWDLPPLPYLLNIEGGIGKDIKAKRKEEGGGSNKTIYPVVSNYLLYPLLAPWKMKTKTTTPIILAKSSSSLTLPSPNPRQII